MNTMNQTWLALFMRGIIALVFGLFLLTYPGLTLVTLIQIFAIFAIVFGLLGIISSFSKKSHRADKTWFIIEGLISLLVGIVVLSWPGITGIIVMFVIAGWALIAGIIQLITSISLAKGTKNRGLLAVIGVLSIIFGSYVFLHPGVGALAIAWVIGLYALLFGILLIVLSLSRRRSA